MSKHWIWLQLLIGWLPIWALFSVLIYLAHDGHLHAAMLDSLRMMAIAAVLGLFVHRLSGLAPWPYPFRIRFLGLHLLAAAAYAGTWLLLNFLVESILHWRWRGSLGPGLLPYLTTGFWLYVMVAGVAYGARAAQRGAQISALEARSQLAALRAQLHPHFLFNALHTVVQLIPVDPRAASRAAEQLADALRSVIEEQRDVLPLADEWAFVQRYLAIESIRFGDRLQINAQIQPQALNATLPCFALQTLVENAVRHAAAPRVEATTVTISANVENDRLRIKVSDDGEGADPVQIAKSAGTGLRRLRERLGWLYGGSAELLLRRVAGGGLVAELLIDQDAGSTLPGVNDDD